MKKIFINMMILSSIAFTGCNDSFLDKTPVTEWEYIFSRPSLPSAWVC